MRFNIFSKICNWIDKRTEDYGAQYVAYGVFGVLNYPISYLIWYKMLPQGDPGLVLRIIATLLALPLIVKNRWPIKLKTYLPLYWYFTLLFSIPFFSMYMLFKNQFSTGWQVNITVGLFLLVLLVDWISFIYIELVGIILGIFAYFLLGGSYFPSKDTIYITFYTYFFAIILGAMFSHNKEKITTEKLRSIKLLSASIAHELRTPLASVSFYAGGLKKYLDPLFQGYGLAIKEKLMDAAIAPQQLDSLKKMPNSLQVEANSALLVIDLLLANIRQLNIQINTPKEFSMVECITGVVGRYPFKEGQRELVEWHPSLDFKVNGDLELMTYVLFNLFRNALYFLSKADKGSDAKITLKLAQEGNVCSLYFKDEGTGISSGDLPYIFDQFFSKNSHHGSGIGLSFCKMVVEAHGGKISCESVLSEYTVFILRFPARVQKVA